MILLNLISPEQQHYLKISCFQILVKNVVGLLIILSVLMSIVLIPLNNRINNLKLNNESLKQSLTLQNTEKISAINSLNKNINDIYNIKNEYFNWPEMIVSLANITPNDVNILELTAGLNDNSFIITGFAKTRDDLITLKDLLNKEERFNNIESPLDNYLLKQNITFQIKGQFN